MPTLIRSPLAALISSIAFMAASPAGAQGIKFDAVAIATHKLSANFYVLEGSPGVDPGHPEAAGGRIGVLVGSDGVFMVDGQYAPLTDKVVAAIRKINRGPIRFLVNTHEHPDHTGGNPNFARLGALVLAREEARAALEQPAPPQLVAAIGKAASFTDPARLPMMTYGMGAPVKLRFDGETIDLIALAPAHTDGDTIVRFEAADVIMIGDFYRNYGYPFIDPTHAGSFAGVVNAIDTVMALAGPNTKLVPGHGTLVTRADLLPYRAMIEDIRLRVQALIDDGKSLQDVLAAKLTAPYDSTVPGALTPLPAGLGTSADRFIAAMYAELKATKS